VPHGWVPQELAAVGLQTCIKQNWLRATLQSTDYWIITLICTRKELAYRTF